MLLYRDKEFVPALLMLAIPVMLQNLLSAALNFVDVFMIGSQGDVSIAAVGGANQFFFFYHMLMFGISSGAGIFAAQYWGRKDFRSLQAVMSIGLNLNLIFSLLSAVAVLLFPRFIMGMFSNDPQVIALGANYMMIISSCFVLAPLAMNYAVVLRSTGQVKLPMYASFLGVGLNTFGNYCLIFGKFGFPAMGVQGAAIATVISRTVEASIIVAYPYLTGSPVAVKMRQLFSIDKELLAKYARCSVPIILQGAGWSLGYTMYSVVYGHLSTESLAAYNLACSIERICLILFMGIGAAASVMIGNQIGAGQIEKAKGYAGNFLLLALMGALLTGFILVIIKGQLAAYYNLSDLSRGYLSGILFVMALILWAKASNIVFHMGILKGGGDTLFSMIVDVGGVWIIGVPLAACGAFVLHWPVHLVVALAAAEEISKAIIAYIRLFTGKWVHVLIENKPITEASEVAVS